MYPKGTELVYSTWTPRTSRLTNVDHVIWFGGQAFYKTWLIDFFRDNFFSRSKEEVITEYLRIIKHTLGIQSPETKHLEDLHDLGYLPLSIKALPEGSRVPIRTPVMTIQNTDSRFFWLTNFVESLASCELWQATTSATLAYEYKKLLNKWALKTVGNTDFTQFQGHDFSMRGMSSLESAMSSGMGHLTSFVGTDTIPAIQGAEILYGANVEKELVGTSIPATEHSIQCAYNNDLEYFTKIITEVHPNGFVSVVSDGYDFWDVIGRVLPLLKNDILARNGGTIGDKVVIRPDSGDPVLIVCGDPGAPEGTLQHKGAVEALWDIFGGTLSVTGYKILDSHIGLIYGDAITLARCDEICKKLTDKGFASINCVYGIGSYTYQYNTRDTFGFALKSTLCIINGREQDIYKDPKTDDGVKKSQKGRVMVYKKPLTGEFTVVDGLSLKDNLDSDCLIEVFRNSKILVNESFYNIRNRIKGG